MNQEAKHIREELARAQERLESAKKINDKSSYSCNHSHYVSQTMNPVELQKFSDWAAMVIKRNCGTKYHLCLIYSGMSGISLSTGIGLSLAKLGIVPSLIYTRKKGEKSHGNKVEFFEVHSKKKVIMYFIDDFVSSGTTLKRTFSMAKDYLGSAKLKIIVTMGSAECFKEYSSFIYSASRPKEYKKWKPASQVKTRKRKSKND